MLRARSQRSIRRRSPQSRQTSLPRRGNLLRMRMQSPKNLRRNRKSQLKPRPNQHPRNAISAVRLIPRASAMSARSHSVPIAHAGWWSCFNRRLVKPYQLTFFPASQFHFLCPCPLVDNEPGNLVVWLGPASGTLVPFQPSPILLQDTHQIDLFPRPQLTIP